MGFRFRESIKIAPGVRVNLNKKSTSVTFGGKGFHHTVSSTGRKTTTAGIPGTGISYTTTEGGHKASGTGRKKSSASASTQNGGKNPGCLSGCMVLMIILLFWPLALAYYLWKTDKVDMEQESPCGCQRAHYTDLGGDTCSFCWPGRDHRDTGNLHCHR